MNTQWNAEVVTPVEEGAGTKVLDNQSNVQPTLEAGSNITIANGEISATGGGAEYTAGSGIDITDNTISVDSDIRSGAAAGATAVQAADLATVATSGSYNDLINTPSIPAAQVNSDWNAASGVAQILNKPTLATVATSGSYADLSNKPTIPTVAQSYNALSTDAMSGTAVAEAISGTGQVPSVTSGDNGKVLKATYEGGVGSFGWDAAPSGVPSTTSSDEGKVLGVTDTSGTLGWVAQTPAQVNSDWNAASGAAQILNKPTLATVATSGSYNDLTNKPSIPAAQVNSDWNAASGVSQILNKPTLATVATSGSYADLSNKPTIPTVDQTYSASSTNAQSGTAVADALSNINQVPASTSADEDKVLTVNSSGTPVWAAAQGGSSYTAGDGIAISGQNAISAKVGDGLEIGSHAGSAVTATLSASSNSNGSVWWVTRLSSDLVNKIETDGIGVTINSIQGQYDFQWMANSPSSNAYPAIMTVIDEGSGEISNPNQRLVLSNTGTAFTTIGSIPNCVPTDVEFQINLNDINTTLSNLTWNTIKANPTNYVLGFYYTSSYGSASVDCGANMLSPYTSYTTGSYSYAVVEQGFINVSNPVPAFNTSTDAGKVLTIGSNGTEWAAESTELPTVTGNAGKVLAVNSGATGVEWVNAPTELPTVTGNSGKVLTVNSGATGTEWTNFTQIEVVASMPASPTSGVLYIVTGS